MIPLDVHVIHDEIPVPGPDLPIEGRATRTDTYPVAIVTGTDATADRLTALAPQGRMAIVTDETVAALHVRALVDALDRRGITSTVTAIPPGEASKALDTAVGLLDELAHSSVGRRDLLVACGGGVVLDTAGWVASAYMRGIPYANVPTTLLGAVDAAIGGKVAVDHTVAKNLIGAFYQPVGVVSNIEYLTTLPGRQIRAGLAEVIKKGMIASPGLFGAIETDLEAILAQDVAALERLVRSASATKCELVARDPYEDDLRRPLNFGHTVGHAVETVTGYGPVLHGEAVAFGMAVATRISLARGWIDPGVADRLVTLLRRSGLPYAIGQLGAAADPDAVVAALGKIRLIRAGRLRFVLPLDVGTVAIADDVTDEEIHRALHAPVPTGLAR
ncbi:3-dehydroquinate synthase [Actinomadura sp. DC4]|uniref:3-dehydroquinate synthase n=1 Tax=Actinomadura sp. DC4 TaxID=3055069 RepID=UPI0025B20DD3|nr:3-dehydroquinate synthase [Actinomadura sp. DC4]MDN3359414.1 3-dehydroquinate synthase [Actinomadura sp. DC4]